MRQYLEHKAVRYCITGVANFGINIGLTYSLHEIAGFPEELAYGSALVTVFALNFFLARHYVFSARDGCARTQFVRFLISALSVRFLEYLAFLFLHSLLGVHYLVAATMILVISFVAKFFLFSRFVFVGAKKA